MPVIRGRIARRILVNYRVDPQAIARLLPPPFAPVLINGFAVAGICLIRLEQIRPHGLSAAFGMASENAAHRIAVEWDEAGITRTGVYIPRRDTNSFLNQVAGGRLFPGVHHAADFRVFECPSRLKLKVLSKDGATRIKFAAGIGGELPKSSIFGSLGAGSEFFRAGSLGWSPGKCGDFEGMELHAFDWSMQSLAVEHVASSFFDDPTRFPPGSTQFDSAFLMQNIEHEWHASAQPLPSLEPVF